MGGSSCDRPKDMTDEEFFEKEYGFKIVKSIRKNGWIYMAYISKNGNILPCATSSYNYKNGIFSHQDLRSVIDINYKCPLEIVNLITYKGEWNEEQINKWKQECIKYNETYKPIKLAKGNKYEVLTKLEFYEGIWNTGDLVECIDPKKGLFKRADIVEPDMYAKMCGREGVKEYKIPRTNRETFIKLVEAVV